MFYYLSELFPYAPWSVFQYITLRSAGAAATALILSWWLGPRVISWLRRFSPEDYTDDRRRVGEPQKRGTPTMGGLLIVLALDFAVLLWARWNPLVLLTVLSMIVLAGLGFYDDYLKVSRRDSQGVRSWVKLWVQLGLALAIAGYLWRFPATSHLIEDLEVPFFKKPVLMGVPAIGIALTMLTIVGSSNAVNLTDGMDGLAIGCTMIVAVVFLVLTYIAGHVKFAQYLYVPYVRNAGELAVVCAALVGACLGFLWFNCHPAEVFMGDTGSLALGGVLGILAVLIHQPFVLFIAGGVFVMEAGSVILQVGWFKYTRRKHGEGRRIFLMSPLHHHFRKLGWPESKIVTRFYIVGILCGLAALSTLKLR